MERPERSVATMWEDEVYDPVWYEKMEWWRLQWDRPGRR